MHIEPKSIARHNQLVGLLEKVCQELELTATQQNVAQERYEAVGAWLAAGSDRRLAGVTIWAQGSVVLGTTSRPIGRNEFDVDLVLFAPGVSSSSMPHVLKGLVGARLRENGRYAPMLIEKPRCWRLDYANEFHLDITPAISNAVCPNGGLLVPCKRTGEWKPSNPKGYLAWFNRHAALQPRFRFMKSVIAADSQRGVEPYPEFGRFKGLLRRIVQLCKRHRDMMFLKDPERAPISVILTTLAARAYAHCVRMYTFDTELEVLQTVIQSMPIFVQSQIVSGRMNWLIPNETTSGENFAEKWNEQQELAEAFFEWQQAALAQIGALVTIDGIDQIQRSMAASFGDGPVTAAVRDLTAGVSSTREKGRLSYIAGGIGLAAAPTVSRAGIVRPNTFYGAE